MNLEKDQVLDGGIVFMVQGNEFEKTNTVYDSTILPLTQKASEWSKSELRKRVLDFMGWETESNFLPFDRPNSGGRLLKEESAEWKALDYLYNYENGRTKDPLDYFWAKNLMNAKAVRNRLRIVKRALKYQIEKFARIKSGNVRILSLACGSAEGLLSVLGGLENNETQRVQVVLVDNNDSALDRAKEIAESHGVYDCVELRNTNVFRRTKRFTQELEPDIVQMIGLLDYLSDRKAVRLMRWIESGLPKGGTFMTCNIFPNPERPFVRDITEWEMIYRQPQDLVSLPQKAGFTYTKVYVEPIRIHGVSISHKLRPR